MNAVHPTFAPLLAAICPPKKPEAPKCPRGYYEYVHDTELGELVCWLEYTEAERETRWEPGCPASASLSYAWFFDIDILHLLDKSMVEKIEAKALAEITDPPDHYMED